MPLLFVILAACAAPARPQSSWSKINIPIQPAITPIIISSELAVGDNRFLLSLLGPDNKPLSDARVELAFYDLGGSAPVAKGSAQARSTPYPYL